MESVEERLLKALQEKIKGRYKAYLLNERKPIKTTEAFYQHAWAYMWDFYKGSIDGFRFIDLMAAEIDNQMTRGWREGARIVDVNPDEMTPDDQAVLDEMIKGETDYLDGVAGDIESFTPTTDDPDNEFRAKFKRRAELWAQGYEDAKSAAQLYFGEKVRLEWVMGATEEHCHTGDHGRNGIGCANLSGMVLYASEWYAVNIKPQSEVTNCGGWQCECRLQPTSKRRTSRGLQKLQDMMAAAGL